MGVKNVNFKAANFQSLIARYVALSGVSINIMLNDGRKIILDHAKVDKENIYNNYNEKNEIIAIDDILFAELNAN